MFIVETLTQQNADSKMTFLSSFADLDLIAVTRSDHEDMGKYPAWE